MPRTAMAKKTTSSSSRTTPEKQLATKPAKPTRKQLTPAQKRRLRRKQRRTLKRQRQMAKVAKRLAMLKQQVLPTIQASCQNENCNENNKTLTVEELLSLFPDQTEETIYAYLLSLTQQVQKTSQAPQARPSTATTASTASGGGGNGSQRCECKSCKRPLTVTLQSPVLEDDEDEDDEHDQYEIDDDDDSDESGSGSDDESENESDSDNTDVETMEYEKVPMLTQEEYQARLLKAIAKDPALTLNHLYHHHHHQQGKAEAKTNQESETTQYKLRAECLADLIRALSLLYNIDMDVDQFGGEMAFPSKLSLGEIRDVLMKVPDGHRMIQTLNFKDKYDGEMWFDDF
eukprot:GILJ01011928.1.p1 GENE.GILJ01011928.1~~GILJ01011928.1.p1  ORF type:complete len:345 (-),score=63.15 GILJ01011928.1:74-1108(-)